MNKTSLAFLRRAALVAAAVTLALSTREASAQGCVAVRGGGLCTMNHPLGNEGVGLESGAWQAFVGYRFFKSDRHYIGGEQSRNAAGLNRFQQGTEVINYSNFIDVGVTYQITPRYSATFVLPFVQHTRSAPYEHSGVRRNTSSGGLADVRASFNAWIWDPAQQPKGNLQVSVGFKAPSGDYAATDTFFQDQDPGAGVDIRQVIRPVDQSIQPGDGGWGATLELNGYRQLASRLIGYAQAFYLFNPQNVNGTPSPTARRDAGPTVGGVNIDNGMSIADQYLFRTGFNVIISHKHAIALSFGGRMEGVPVEDLNGNAGDKEGFRRPGYAISVEPGISWMPGRWNVNLTAPLLVAANRERSYWDEQKGRHGDAAFADYLISLSVSRMF